MNITELIVVLVTIGIVFAGVMTFVGYGSLLERKISAWVQDRLGPNRVGFDLNQPFLSLFKGFFGLGQPLADGVKFLLKEEFTPKNVDKVFYYLAPAVALSTALIAFAVVPFGPTSVLPPLVDNRIDLAVSKPNPNYQHRVYPRTNSELEKISAANPFRSELLEEAKSHSPKIELPKVAGIELGGSEIRFGIAPHLDIGVLFVFAVSSLAVYGVVLAGWSSNSKYSLFGALRASAQLISYEIPMGMSILVVVFMVGSLNLEAIVEYQAKHTWFIVYQPLGCLLFLTAIFAECNRLPFDLPECEQELVGGYHTEYSSMKFACFMMGEYTHMVTTSFLLVAMFFGGWNIPFLVTQDFPEGALGWGAKLVVFCGKMVAVIVFFMLVRWSLLRFRFDQLMSLAWKGLMTLGILNTLGAVVIIQTKPLGELSLWLLPAWSVIALLVVTGYSMTRPKPSNRFRTGIKSVDQRLSSQKELVGNRI
ncbi:MAG: NADH-quinone oxidoreductase subunit H [Planctomycetota bacterium]|nr:NADH-quinone oxidoreductase subunit H [Planctomycetota bacterium]RLT18449.1 MAG: NADH-quinone oxidoreductase subunit H [Planctomycetota bacterium]